MKRYVGEIGLTITAIVWGSGFVATAIALDYYTPYQLLAGRFIIGFLLLAVVFSKQLMEMKKSTIIKGVILGSILYVGFALQTVGLQFTTPSKNAFLTAVNVVIVPFIGFFIYRQRINTYEFIGAIIAIIGVATLSLQFTSEINIGDALTLLCAVAFAFHIFYTSRFVREEDPIALTIVQMLTAAVVGSVIMVGRGEIEFQVTPEALLPLLYLGVFSTTVAYLLQTMSQKYITETKTAIILSTEAFWGTAFSIIILHELISSKMIIGSVLILLAILISEIKPSLFKNDMMRRKTE